MSPVRRFQGSSRRLPAWLTVVTTVISATALLGPGPAAAVSPAPRCAELAAVRIPPSATSLPTRGGRVQSAAVTTQVVSGATVEYCDVRAALSPIDPSAPDIRLQIAMPADWNRDTMMFGGGGFNGTIPAVTQNVPFGRPDRAAPLARGYATYASDAGHQAGPTGSLDGSFGVNDEALRNFAAGDALKKTHDAATYLIRRGYRAGPARAYFAGGSTGGREALVVAQRWPDAFDGVISAYPAWNNLAEILHLGHLARVMSRPGAFPGPDKQTLLYDSVMAACDARDGIADKIISNDRGCHFDPRVLRCPDGADTGPACLSDPQIAAVTAASTPFSWPYRIASGERYYPGFPLLSGADMRTPYLGFGTSAPANPMPATSAYGFQYWDQWVKYFLTRDPGQNSLEIDPRRPGKWLPRISHLSTIQDRNDADLRPFARSGGRLLLMHGSADELVSHRSTNDYYRRVLGQVGARQTHQFMRYHLVPGANHANFGAPAFAATWDSLSALEQWVEEGRPPVEPVAVDSRDGRTRPLCEYPRWPRYRSGDPGRAESFRCSW
ncbi:tannase/feruloyl esterase family alpha/beta hydrolase [Jidongwangia harbinensis]|uniref:tannase/feruloyl esterase family alpha/beta hydrolase n=1 Tax=Jidongwangia harbinensis TaxID=2878561 RepID=UPI001CD95C82|nr:tannase/feruloyl esterase family alpha/beta hydrolase [Jidongwangia harbinensis]MCA2211454.1 tannase/feruloyl esterase family alpha/beta hydrolase [Jidongwangia harbinensis]